jgi:catechol 2,3-dioxygenase-like lactoylglutathione lyase family enzyme
VEVLASRLLLRPVDLEVSRQFYRDVLGLAVFREYGDAGDPGVVFFLGGGYLELAHSLRQAHVVPTSSIAGMSLWLQVRDLAGQHQRLVDLDVPIQRTPRREPWGLLEMWITDPDGVPIVLVEAPDDHPLRRDTRT